MFRVRLASIKSQSMYPCVSCLVQKSKIRYIGSDLDNAPARKDDYLLRADVQRARDLIFREGKGVRSKLVEAMLPHSVLPVRVRIPTKQFLRQDG